MRRKRSLNGIDFGPLFPNLTSDQRADLVGALRAALAQLQELRRHPNHPPSPAQVVTELRVVQQRLLDASVYLRALTASPLLQQMADEVGTQAKRYEATKRIGRPRRHRDRGLQILAVNIERHLRQHYFPAADEMELRRLVLKILVLSGESVPDRARDIRAFFTPSPFLS